MTGKKMSVHSCKFEIQFPHVPPPHPFHRKVTGQAKKTQSMDWDKPGSKRVSE